MNGWISMEKQLPNLESGDAHWNQRNHYLFYSYDGQHMFCLQYYSLEIMALWNEDHCINLSLDDEAPLGGRSSVDIEEFSGKSLAMLCLGNEGKNHGDK